MRYVLTLDVRKRLTAEQLREVCAYMSGAASDVLCDIYGGDSGVVDVKPAPKDEAPLDAFLSDVARDVTR